MGDRSGLGGRGGPDLHALSGSGSSGSSFDHRLREPGKLQLSSSRMRIRKPYNELVMKRFFVSLLVFALTAPSGAAAQCADYLEALQAVQVSVSGDAQPLPEVGELHPCGSRDYEDLVRLLVDMMTAAVDDRSYERFSYSLDVFGALNASNKSGEIHSLISRGSNLMDSVEALMDRDLPSDDYQSALAILKDVEQTLKLRAGGELEQLDVRLDRLGAQLAFWKTAGLAVGIGVGLLVLSAMLLSLLRRPRSGRAFEARLAAIEERQERGRGKPEPAGEPMDVNRIVEAVTSEIARRLKSDFEALVKQLDALESGNDELDAAVKSLRSANLELRQAVIESHRRLKDSDQEGVRRLEESERETVRRLEESEQGSILRLVGTEREMLGLAWRKLAAEHPSLAQTASSWSPGKGWADQRRVLEEIRGAAESVAALPPPRGRARFETFFEYVAALDKLSVIPALIKGRMEPVEETAKELQRIREFSGYLWAVQYSSEIVRRLDFHLEAWVRSKFREFADHFLCHHMQLQRDGGGEELDAIREQVVEALRWGRIEPVEIELGKTPFDGALHDDFLTANKPECPDGVIVDVARCGFRDVDGELLTRPEVVVNRI